MSTKIAIVGSGVTAGLTANLLAKRGEITLFQSPNPFSSGIPEIVPRRAFFDALDTINEDEVITRTAPVNQRVLWRHNDKFHRRLLVSNEEYFVYDKGRLAKFLAECVPVARYVKQEVSNIADLKGFDRIFDCRGAKSVMSDHAYQSHFVQAARTACRYLVTHHFPDKDADEMCFWSEHTVGGSRRTFFKIPVANNRASLGCSCLPSELISADELLIAMATKGIAVRPENIIFSGSVEPEEVAMSCSVNHVVPLGDARYLSCPLSEYGTLKALSQVKEATGENTLLSQFFKRPNNGEIDPHFPQELFL
ncbi:hypothetical protein CBW54_00605 [Yersinia kristensenii]|nr:hypothetical protein CBW54_00605 [Yersinia kristensenii]